MPKLSLQKKTRNATRHTLSRHRHPDHFAHILNTPRRILSTSTNSAQTSTLTSHSPSPRRKVYKYQCLDPQVPYQVAHQWMNDLLALKTRKEDPYPDDIIFVVQHQPVYTLGRAATLDNIKFQLDSSSQEFDVQRIARGGEVTYHGPGQLTVYPILNLNNYKKDLHWYVKQLEDTVIHTLKQYDIEGTIDPDNPGVWVNDAKVSALGCSFSRWTTIHGFAFNVTPECRPGFDRIVPCGIQDRTVISLQELVDPSLIPKIFDKTTMIPSKESPAHSVNLETVADQLMKSFEEIFNVEVVESDHVYDHYDTSLETFNAQPRLWLRDIERPL